MSFPGPAPGAAAPKTWVCVIILSGDVSKCCSRLEHVKLTNADIIPPSRLFQQYPITPTIDPIRFSQWLTTKEAPEQQEWKWALDPQQPQHPDLQVVRNKLATSWSYVPPVNASIDNFALYHAWNQLEGGLNDFRDDKSKFATVIGFSRKIKGLDERLAYTLLVVKAGPYQYPTTLVSDYCNQLLKQYIGHVPPVHAAPTINMPCREIPNIDGAPTTTTTSTTTNFIDTELSGMQKAVGREIYNKLVDGTRDKGYTSFRFVLLVPPRISLYNQSVKRYTEMFPQHVRDKHGAPIIIRAGRGAESRQAYDRLIQDAQQSRDTLYVLIQDECHWGMALGSQLDQYLNSRGVLDCDNIYILHVSATPYNILAIPTIRKKQIIKWDDVASTSDELKQINGAYRGFHYLKENNYLREHDSKYNWSKKFLENDVLQTLLFNVRNQPANSKYRFNSTGWSIAFEYILNLHYLLSNQTSTALPFYSPHTQEILYSLLSPTSDNGTGNLAVIRTNNGAEADFLKSNLLEVLKHYNKLNVFDVIADTSADETRDLWDLLPPASRQRYMEWRKTSIDVINKQIHDGTLRMDYSQLKHLPLLLIVVDKGRMGDTFPSNFKYFDLRPRYTNSESTYHCTLLQDVGRAFGYRERPVTYLAQGVIDLIPNDILDAHQTLQRSKPAAAVPSNQDDDDDDDAKDFADTDKDEKKDEKKDYGFDPYVDLHEYFCLGNDHQIHTSGTSPNKVKVGNVTFTSLSSDHPALGRRFVLSAHPQNGKTGSVFYAIHLLWHHFNQHDNDDSKETKQHITQLYEFRRKTSRELHHDIINNTNNIRQVFIEWHQHQDSIDQRAQQNKHILPYEKIIQVITKCVNESIAISKSCREKRPFIIVDMGCGSARIAQHYHAYGNQILVKSIDHIRLPTVPPHIWVDVASMDTTGVDGDSAAVVVFCLSLWGISDDIGSYLRESYRICSPGGIMLIIEARNNQYGNTYNRLMIDELNNAILAAGFTPRKPQNITLAGQDKYALWIAQKPEITEVDMDFS